MISLFLTFIYEKKSYKMQKKFEVTGVFLMVGLNDLDDVDDDNPYTEKNNKKILIFLIPILIIIGIIVGLYYLFSPQTSVNKSYSIVESGNEKEKNVTVFYDFPELKLPLQTNGTPNSSVRIKINIELSKMEDIKIIEGFMPKLTDAMVTHITELTPEEIEDSEGMYWLKEELLYRFNLIVAPIKIKDINYKMLEVQKSK